MAPAPPTVVSLKQTFLNDQTRLLSQPLSPSPAWLNNNVNNNDPDNPPLPEKAVHDALFKLNHRLQQHARRVYPPQATRHVAEQIDQLYWNAAVAAAEGDEEADADGGDDELEALNLGADLTNPAVIATIPSTWESNDPDPDATASPLLEQYSTLSSALHDLAQQKQQAALRVARLRRMRALLEPFSPTSGSQGQGADATMTDADAGGGADETNGLQSVQENLVTRNGAIEKELLRMRMLLARVGGRVAVLKEKQQRQSSSSSGIAAEPSRKGKKRGRDDAADQQTAGSRGDSASASSAGSLFSERGAVEDVEVEERRKVGMLLGSF